MRNFPTEFWKRIQESRDETALVVVEGGAVERLSYREWMQRVQNLATALMDVGFEAGARLGLVANNGRDYLDLVVACWLVGGCVVPLVPGRERRETLRCLGRSGCEWIAISDEQERGRLRGSGSLPGHLKWIILEGEALGENTFGIGELEEKGWSLNRRGRAKELAKRIYEQKAGAPVLILFAPEPGEEAQGAFFSGKKVAYQLEGIAHQMGLGGEDGAVVVSALSFGWFSSFLITMAALYGGKTVAIASSLRRMSDELSRLKPTHLISGPAYLEQLSSRWQQRLDEAPEMLRRLAGETGDDEADSSKVLRTIGSLGSVGERLARRLLYEPIREEFGGRLKAIQVFEAKAPQEVYEILEKIDVALLGHFGVPEVGISHMEHPKARRSGSVGRPIEGIAAKIGGAKTGESGELYLRGDLLFDGYWAGEGVREVGADGWLRTGRRGRLESGFLYLED